MLVCISGAVRELHGGGGDPPAVPTPHGIFLDGPGRSQPTAKSFRPRQEHFSQDQQEVKQKHHVGLKPEASDPGQRSVPSRRINSNGL